MSESRVHLVISRYSFVREVTRLRENLARVLSLSLSLSHARKEKGEEGGHEKRSPFEDTSVEVVATRWCATTTSSKEREGAVIPRGEESRGNTWKDRVIYCYGRLQHGVLVVCGCQGKKRDSRGRRRGLRFGRTLFPSLAVSPLPCPPCPMLALSVEHFGIYKYRYQALSLFPRAVTQPLEPRNHYTRVLFLARAVPPLPRSLSRPFCSVRMQRAAHSWYTPLGVQHLPT